MAVGPLFLATGLTAILFFAVPDGVSRWWGVATGGLTGVVLLVTALFAVPLHTALSAGFDDVVFRRLLRVDTVRLVAAAAATAVGVWATVAAG